MRLESREGLFYYSSVMTRLPAKSFLLSVAAALLTALPLAAAQAPPFGNSLTWETGREGPSLEALRGKSVLVVFFQSWCGICNGWSGGLFKQLGETYQDDPRVVLVAIKTDGGSTNDAVDYLKSRTDPDHWLVAVDDNATYHRQATGKNSLYYYMWVTPEGAIGEMAKSGTYLTGSNPKAFTLATPKSKEKFQKGASALMPADPPFAEALKPAIRRAEQGLFLTALKEVSRLSSDSALKDDVARFRKCIAARLEAVVATHAKTLEDEGNEGRYLAYLSLCSIADDFGSSAPGKAARQAASAQESSSWLSDEKEAQRDYESTMRRAARADDERSKARIKRALEKIADEYPDTTYGRIAGAS